MTCKQCARKSSGWSARECIAWLRIVRPGSVLGTQQQYLEKCQLCISKELPLPEPDSVEKGDVDRTAQEVKRGMLRRRDRRRSSASKSSEIGDTTTEVAITPDEASLIDKISEDAVLGYSQAKEFPRTWSDSQRRV